MKTIVIFDQCGQEPLSFFISQKNLTSLDNVYINASNTSKKKEEKALALIYNKDGKLKPKMLESFPVDKVDADTKVITIGFIP